MRDGGSAPLPSSPARLFRRDRLHVLTRRRQDRLDDVVIPRAAAEIALEIRPNLPLAGLRVVTSQPSASTLRADITFLTSGLHLLEADADSEEEDAVSRLTALTNQQSRILQLICEGKPNKQIAFNLSISAIKANLITIMRKLGAQSRRKAVLIARKASFAGMSQEATHSAPLRQVSSLREMRNDPDVSPAPRFARRTPSPEPCTRRTLFCCKSRWTWWICRHFCDPTPLVRHLISLKGQKRSGVRHRAGRAAARVRPAGRSCRSRSRRHRTSRASPCRPLRGVAGRLPAGR